MHQKPVRRLLFLVGLALGCAVTPPEEEGGISDFFPLKVGHAWTYANFDPTGKQFGDPWSYRVSSSSSNGKSTIYYRNISIGPIPQDAYFKDDTGVYTVGNSGDLVERRIAYPVVLNREWAFRAPGVFTDNNGNPVSYMRRARVEATEPLTLFKGLKFDETLKIHYITEGPSRPAEIFRWYAKGIGLVREVRLFGPNRIVELTAYSLDSPDGK